MVKIYVPASKTTIFTTPSFSYTKYLKHIVFVYGIDIVSIIISIVVFSKLLNYIFPLNEDASVELDVFNARIIPIEDLDSSNEEFIVGRTLIPEKTINWKQIAEIREHLRQQPRALQEELCSLDVCYQVYDCSSGTDYESTMQRHLVQTKEGKEMNVGTAELQIPEDLSWANANTSTWSIHTLVIVSQHTKAMMASAFFTQGLKLNEVFESQNLLILGSGIGVIASLLSQFDDLMFNITEVEPRYEIIRLSKKWFSHENSSDIRNENISTFIVNEHTRGAKYNCVIIEICLEGVCPADNLVESYITLSEIVEDNGVVIVHLQNSENQAILQSFQEVFASCFLFNYDLERKDEVMILICANRQNWTWIEQKQLFKEALWKVDDILDFRMNNFLNLD